MELQQSSLVWMLFLLALAGGGVCDSCTENNETRLTYEYGEMALFADSTVDKVCIMYPSDHPLPGNIRRYKLENFTSINPCDDTIQSTATLVPNENNLLFMRDIANCSLMNYLSFAEDQNASGLIIWTEKLHPLNLGLGRESSLDVLVYIVSPVYTSRITNLMEKEPYAEFRDLDPEGFEWSSVILLCAVACFCVAVGALTTPCYEPHNTRQQILDYDATDASRTIVQPDTNPTEVSNNDEFLIPMSVFISAILMLLYLFFGCLVNFLMVAYAILSAVALFEILDQILNLFQLDVRMPNIVECEIHKWVLVVVCTAVPITWVILRHTKYIWILENGLGVCICIQQIQLWKVPNLKIFTVLLSLFFALIIFLIFVTVMTPNGKNVVEKVQVAANGTFESLPWLIKVPRIRHTSACFPFDSGFSLLVGDIVLPGVLAGYANACDLHLARSDKNRPYFLTVMLGYAVGLAFTVIRVHRTKMEQPKLVYIVLCTLLPLLIAGAVRKQFRVIWFGVVRK